MVEIDWVRIPGARFPIGYTAAQADLIRQMAQEYAHSDVWSDEQRALIEGHIVALRAHGRSPQPPELEDMRRDWPRLNRRLNIERDLLLAGSGPPVTIDMKPFYISRFPITCQQCRAFYTRYGQKGLYKQYVEGKPMPNPRHPQAVTWHVADLFSRWVGGRLPTVQEWLYAALGADERLYPWGNEWNILRGNFDRYTRPKRLGDEGRITPVDAYPEGQSPMRINLRHRRQPRPRRSPSVRRRLKLQQLLRKRTRRPPSLRRRRPPLPSPHPRRRPPIRRRAPRFPSWRARPCPSPRSRSRPRT